MLFRSSFARITGLIGEFELGQSRCRYGDLSQLFAANGRLILAGFCVEDTELQRMLSVAEFVFGFGERCTSAFEHSFEGDVSTQQLTLLELFSAVFRVRGGGSNAGRNGCASEAGVVAKHGCESLRNCRNIVLQERLLAGSELRTERQIRGRNRCGATAEGHFRGHSTCSLQHSYSALRNAVVNRQSGARRGLSCC